jgi:hypothetical protein
MKRNFATAALLLTTMVFGLLTSCKKSNTQEGIA